jgi:hypothetical protein
MKMKIWLGAVATACSWLLGYYAVRILGRGLAAVDAYAVLTGWWLSLYVVSKFQIPVRASIPLVVGSMIALVCTALLQLNWFYHDVPNDSPRGVVSIAFLQSLFVASPILLDWLVNRLMQLLARVGRRA